jgi:DNA-binding LacI/PurR family transcriptional regulator
LLRIIIRILLTKVVSETGNYPNNSRVTMKDIAARAGVATSTVCRALSVNPQIPEATRRRIQKVAASMGYRPDPLLSAFASRRRGGTSRSDITTIAYLTHFRTCNEWRDNPFYRRCHQGAEARLESLGYKLEHFWLGQKGMSAARLSKILYTRGIQGLFLAPIPEVHTTIAMDWERFSAVTVGYSFVTPNLHRVTPHHFHGIQEALHRLFEAGYQRIGVCIFSETSRRVDDLWLSGSLLAQSRRLQSGNSRTPTFSVSNFLFNDSTFKNVSRWCRREKLDVVISDNQIVMSELQAAGIRVPGQVDFMTLNWEEDHPEVSGIDQRPAKIGAATMDMLISAIQRGERGVPEVPLTTMVEGCWRDGESLLKLQHSKSEAAPEAST